MADRRPDRDGPPDLVVTREQYEEDMRHALPPTEDDVSIFWDGRVVNTKERLLAILEEIEANERAGVTMEELERRSGGVPALARIDWDWDPATYRRG